MMLKKIIAPIIDIIGRRRAKRLVSNFEHFLSKEEKVLDIGAGGGWNSERLEEEKQAQVTLLDVINLNQTKLPLQLYDGTKIPFKDNSFDTTMLLFVLHHCQDPAKVLKDAIRVSKKRIVIMEDTFGSRLDRVFLSLYDTVANSPSFLVEAYGMNLPYNFKKISEWKEVFSELGLKIVHTQKIQRFPITQTLFVLEK